MQTRDIPSHPLQELNPLHFKIERINHVNHYNPLKIHRHDYFEIFVFEEGGGYHLVDFEQIPILSRQIHFVTPGQVHQIHRATDSSGFVLLFSEEFYHFNHERSDFLFRLPFFYDKTQAPAMVLSVDDFKNCLQIVEKMLAVFTSKSSQQKSVLQSYLNILLCSFLDSYELQSTAEVQKTPGLALFQQFKIAVEKNFRSLHEVTAYGEMLLASPRQLNDYCKKYAGSSAVEFIHHRLALEAKRLLYYTESNISEIGYDLGFEDPAHFSRFVRKSTGRTPTEWRKQESE